MRFYMPLINRIDIFVPMIIYALYTFQGLLRSVSKTLDDLFSAILICCLRGWLQINLPAPQGYRD